MNDSPSPPADLAPRRYGSRFKSALAYACGLHADQVRKGNGAPYISHPLAVAALVAEYGGDEDQAIAALLHDVLEDCPVTPGELSARYGDAVAAMVVSCTDTTERPKPPWRPRKEAFVARARTVDAPTRLVIAADKLHNAQCIVRDLHRPSVGLAVWERFRADREEQLWYYRAMVAALGDGWDHDLLVELGRTVDLLAQ